MSAMAAGQKAASDTVPKCVAAYGESSVGGNAGCCGSRRWIAFVRASHTKQRSTKPSTVTLSCVPERVARATERRNLRARHKLARTRAHKSSPQSASPLRRWLQRGACGTNPSRPAPAVLGHVGRAGEEGAVARREARRRRARRARASRRRRPSGRREGGPTLQRQSLKLTATPTTEVAPGAAAAAARAGGAVGPEELSRFGPPGSRCPQLVAEEAEHARGGGGAAGRLSAGIRRFTTEQGSTRVPKEAPPFTASVPGRV